MGVAMNRVLKEVALKVGLAVLAMLLMGGCCCLGGFDDEGEDFDIGPGFPHSEGEGGDV